MLTRDAILAHMQRRTKVEHSAVFGGDLRIRELLRSEYKAIDARADTQAQGDSTRLITLRNALRQWAITHTIELDADAQTAFWLALQAGHRELDVDAFNGGIFAAAVVGDDGEPLFKLAEVLAFPQRPDVWDEIQRIATIVIDLSEVGPEALKELSADLPETTDAIPSTAAS